MIKKLVFLMTASVLILAGFSSCTRKAETAKQHLKAASAFWRAGNSDSALVEYKLALRADSKNVEAHQAYQDLLRWEFQKEDEIYDEYKAKAEKHPNDPVWQYLFAWLETDNEKKKEAAETILKKNPKFYYGYLLLGQANSGLGYDDDAGDAYQKALALKPDGSEPYYYLASIAMQNNEYDKAAEYYEKVYSQDSTRTSLLPTIWRMKYIAAEDKETAKKEMLVEVDRALAKYPKDLDLRSSLVWTLQSAGEAERVTNLEKEIAALDSTGKYKENGDYNAMWQKSTDKERMKAAEAFLAAHPKSQMRKYVFNAYFMYASRVPGIADNKVDAIAQQWLSEYPNNSDAYNTVVWDFYLKKPKYYAKGLELAEKGVALSPRRSKNLIMDTYGWAFYKNGRYKEAVQTMLKADSLYGEPDFDVRYHLGASYLGLGDVDKAVEYLGQAVALKEDEDARAEFYKAWEKKHGTREGANAYLDKNALSFSAVTEPYPAPDFTLANLKGDTVAFADHIGKVRLVNFWKPG